LKIYSLDGKEVVSLVNNENKSTGTHTISWNGLDQNGNYVATGVYVLKFWSSDFIQTKKMIFLK